MNKILSFTLLGIVAIFLMLSYESKFKGDVIKLGMSAPFSGNKADLGSDIYVGANAYFQDINENGGVYGRFFKIIKRDNRYEPRIAVENAKKFIDQDKIFAFFATVGTPTSKAILPIAIKNNIPFIGAFSGAEFLNQNESMLVLNARVSYEQETEKLIHYFVDIKKFTRIAVFYQNDSYGISGLRGVRKALDKRDLKIIGEGSYKRNTLSVGNSLYEIGLTRPDAIILVGTTMPVAQFIKRARKDRKIIKNINFGVLSFVNPRLLLKTLDYRSKNIFFSQVVPSPWTSRIAQVIKYRELMSKYYPKKDFGFISLEGYFMARMTVQLFKDVGENFNKDDFIKEMNRISNNIKSSSRSKDQMSKCYYLHRVYLMRYTDGRFDIVSQK